MQCLFAPRHIPPGPYRFINREFLIITYETDLDKLKAVVPEPLEVVKPWVKYEFIRMPDSSGFGDYTESGQVIPVHYKGKPGNYVHSMYLDSEPPIAAGREIWGFPKTLAKPSLRVDSDVLIGEMYYQGVRVALGTMGYKYKAADTQALEKDFSKTPNYLLKIIPHVDGTPRICELVSHYLTDVKIKGAWEGPGRTGARCACYGSCGRSACSTNCIRRPYCERSDASLWPRSLRLSKGFCPFGRLTSRRAPHCILCKHWNAR